MRSLCLGPNGCSLFQPRPAPDSALLAASLITFSVNLPFDALFPGEIWCLTLRPSIQPNIREVGLEDWVWLPCGCVRSLHAAADLLPCRDPTGEIQTWKTCCWHGGNTVHISGKPTGGLSQTFLRLLSSQPLDVFVNNLTSTQGSYTLLSGSQHTLQDCGNITH